MKLIPASIIVWAALAAGCSSNTDNSENNHQTAAPATTAAKEIRQLPAFTVMDMNGKAVDLKSFAGKKVFVNLWASWCPPCRAEMPSIEKLYSSVNKEKAVFVMLSLDNDFETAKKFAATKGLQLPVYYPSDNLPELFNVRGIPATFIFNEQGQLIEQREGADNYDTDAYRQLMGS